MTVGKSIPGEDRASATETPRRATIRARLCCYRGTMMYAEQGSGFRQPFVNQR